MAVDCATTGHGATKAFKVFWRTADIQRGNESIIFLLHGREAKAFWGDEPPGRINAPRFFYMQVPPIDSAT